MTILRVVTDISDDNIVTRPEILVMRKRYIQKEVDLGRDIFRNDCAKRASLLQTEVMLQLGLYLKCGGKDIPSQILDLMIHIYGPLYINVEI